MNALSAGHRKTLMHRRSFLPNLTCTLSFFFLTIFSSVNIFAQGEPFTKRVVATGFASAWEVLYGPNDSLWVTENSAYTISRVSIATGVKTQLINLKVTDPNNFSTGQQPQGGLMGLAIHPNLYSSDPLVRAAKPWVYAAYVYNRGSCPGTNTSCIFTTKIVRFDYNGSTLSNPVTIINTIPGSSDHNSGRLVFGPDIESGSDAAHTQYRLYYTVGDMGCGQFLNTTRTENAQNRDVMEGKVLRLNSESDGDPGQDAWVPNDNPFFDNAAITPQDYVYSLGHRNPQGLAWGTVNGTNYLYSTEQMDKVDDEVNIIQRGKNYGWDQISGYCDGNVNSTKIGQNTSANELKFCTDSAAVSKEPIYTVYTIADSFAYRAIPAPNSQWPTAALSSVDFYHGNKIPNWTASLLMTGLKRDWVFRLKLNANGDGPSGDTIKYFAGDGNRIRRIMSAPDGIHFYVARDAGATSNGGAIMEYTYTGALLAYHELNPQRPQILPEDIRIFPSPADDRVTVEGKKNLLKPLHVQLFDLSGIELRDVKTDQNSLTVNLSGLQSGVYVLKVYDGNNNLAVIRKITKR
jgi:aldose sugar dehydrogenase